MEVNKRQNVKEKCKQYSVNGCDVSETEDCIKRFQNDREGFLPTSANTSKLNTNKKNACYNSIKAKSDSWFILSEHQKVQILPNKNNQLLYFSCGDIEGSAKNSGRVVLSDEELLEKIKPCQDYENKIKELKKFIEKNLEVADLKINLYISACNKHCLSPYPSYIIEESTVGMESLALINDFIPPVGLLKHYFKKTNHFIPNEHVINVLHWLLINFSEPNFTKIDNDQFQRILNKVDNLSNIRCPNHMFVIKYKRINEGLWANEKKTMGAKFAFLPVNMEHAHSVIHLGIHPQIFIDGVHGIGVYLTTDIECCLQSIPAQWVWGKSMLGIETQMIMLVEFITHPSVITYTEKKAICKEKNSTENEGKSGILYFVPSHKLIRIRYIMLYVKTPSSLNSRINIKYQEGLELYKQTALYLTLTLAAIVLAKRVRFTSVAKNILSGIAKLPLIKQCLSIVH